MFEQLFRYPGVVRRHRDGPFAHERATYLAGLASRGSATETLLNMRATAWPSRTWCRATPPDQSFTTSEIDGLARKWAAARVHDRGAATPRRPLCEFRAIATTFLESLGRLTPPPKASCPYAREVDDFVAEQRDRLRSPTTCRVRRWQIERFLSYLGQTTCELAAVTPQHVDAYFEHLASRWSRISIRSAALALRIWFRHCEAKGWVRPGLAAAILCASHLSGGRSSHRPTWDTIARVMTEADGDTAVQRRNGAILRLLAIYGMRSGEVRRLQVQDVDWASHRIQIIRSKSGKRDILPLEPSVERALSRYLREARPQSDHAALFLSARAPFRPISASALYHLVASRLPATEEDRRRKGRGPHGLRHACARHLIEAGLSFKEVGDHLGHRSPDSTQIYAKVNLAALRLVALEDLGGLL